MNYNEKYTRIADELAELIRASKTESNVNYTYKLAVYDVSNRILRVQLIDRITYDYMTEHADYVQAVIERWYEKGAKGERPTTPSTNSALLERLADAILDEELTDTHPDKMTRNEYPIMSDRQESGRRDREYSLSLAGAYDLDGVNRAKPERRRRIAKEERFIDKASRAKNRQRNAQYKRDTSAGPVVRYNLRDTGGELTEPYVDCVGISARLLIR